MVQVQLDNVSVSIPVYDASSLRLVRLPALSQAKVGGGKMSRAGSVLMIDALSDLDLRLAEGDRVCLIGHNGAGKTTLLRLIASIYPPTAGRIEIDGKVMALLGGNLTLNADATGYENIKLAAWLYDWPKEKLPHYVRDIEEFTGLGEYLSLPARTYSLGMLARLAFAMATIGSPDVLVLDEGIGAADAQFQHRAEARARDFVSRAKIMVLASHSAVLCKALCNKALLLSKGRSVFFGDVEEAFARYAGAAVAGRNRRGKYPPPSLVATKRA